MEEISRYHRLYKFPNGATLIYYKHNVNNTTKFAVGFVGGSRKDGKIKGTAHFLEHMLCKETPKISMNFINKFVRNNNIESNAFTSENYVVLYADTPNSSLNETCELYRRLLKNKKFNQQSIDLERMAIEQEILMAKDENQGVEDIRRLIQKNFKANAILGTKSSIAKIDEKVLNDYIERNFVSENLVISVVSKLEFEEVKDIVENHFVYAFKSNPEKINKPVKPKYYPPANIIDANIVKDCKTVNIDILYSTEQTEKEMNLYSLVEDFVFNGFSGKLLKKLRTDKGLVYSANFEPIMFPNNLAFKCITAITSKKYINDVIDTIGEIIADIVKNGMSEKDYQDFQNMVLSMEERRSGIKTISPLVLLDRYINDSEIFFNNQIHSIKNLSREDVNDYLKKVYKKANIMLNIEGDFDPKKIYSVNDMEKHLHAKQSKILYNQETGLLLIPDNYNFVEKEIPEKILNKLENSGKLGFVSGNYFSKIIDEKILNECVNNIAEGSIIVQDEKTGKLIEIKNISQNEKNTMEIIEEIEEKE